MDKNTFLNDWAGHLEREIDSLENLIADYHKRPLAGFSAYSDPVKELREHYRNLWVARKTLDYIRDEQRSSMYTSVGGLATDFPVL